MTDHSADIPPAALEAALGDASREARGLPPAVERLVRSYARSRRLAGDPIERVIVDIKAMVREHAANDELVFVPRLVGWTVAGYFASIPRTATGDD